MTSKTVSKYNSKIERPNRELKSVKLSLMKVSPVAQRKSKPQWASYIAANMDLDKFGTPELSYRDGYFFIMDGQNRIAGLKKWLGGEGHWEDEHLDCWVSTGLSEKEEADRFLGLGSQKKIDAFEKFKIALTAEHEAETAIARIVKEEQLIISLDDRPGAVGAAAVLVRIYERDGADILRAALQITRDSYGDAALKGEVIEGIALLCRRYNGVLNAQEAISALSSVHGGVNGLLGAAGVYRQKTGSQKIQCIAAAAVDIINRSRSKTEKLKSWWK
jgi:hypothetical protein